MPTLQAGRYSVRYTKSMGGGISTTVLKDGKPIGDINLIKPGELKSLTDGDTRVIVTWETKKPCGSKPDELVVLLEKTTDASR